MARGENFLVLRFIRTASNRKYYILFVIKLQTTAILFGVNRFKLKCVAILLTKLRYDVYHVLLALKLILCLACVAYDPKFDAPKSIAPMTLALIDSTI